MELQLNQYCTACHGTGIRSYNTSPGGPMVEENPCLECGGDGRSPASFRVESDWFDDITDTLTEQAKVLVDMADKIDDIMDKCNDIFEKVNE